jgi:hypothetical protein
MSRSWLKRKWVSFGNDWLMPFLLKRDAMKAATAKGTRPSFALDEEDDFDHGDAAPDGRSDRRSYSSFSSLLAKGGPPPPRTGIGNDEGQAEASEVANPMDASVGASGASVGVHKRNTNHGASVGSSGEADGEHRGEMNEI